MPKNQRHAVELVFMNTPRVLGAACVEDHVEYIWLPWFYKDDSSSIPPSHKPITPQRTMAYNTERVKAGNLESDDIVIA